MAVTSCMRNSIVGDDWIKHMCELNPVGHVLDEQGRPTGNITTGPVRLMFTDSIFTAKPQMKSDPNSKLKHSCAVLFTPYTNMQLFYDEYYRIAASDFASFYQADGAGGGNYYGLDNPLVDQGSKAGKYEGFTPGLIMMSVSSNYKPPVVDSRMNPIVDESQIYPGVWVILALNAYASGKQAPRKGPRFGLQTIMKIADDTNCGGGAPDPRQQFRGVQAPPPVSAPAAAFGRPPTAPGMTGMPPAAAPYYSGAAPQTPAYPPQPSSPPALGTDDLSQFA